MKDFISKYGKTVLIMTVVFVSIILIATAVTMLWQYSNEISEQTKVKASYSSFVSKESVADALEAYTEKAVYVAGKGTEFSSSTSLCNYFRHIKEQDGFGDVLQIRYYWGDTLFDEAGDVYTAADASRSFRESTPNAAGFIGIFTDTTVVSGEMEVIGFYAPVSGSVVMDAVVLYYPRQEIQKLTQAGAFPESNAEFSLLSTSTGTVVVGRGEIDNYRVLDMLLSYSGDKSTVNQVARLLKDGECGVVSIRINEDDYLISVMSDKDSLGNLSVVELYKVEVLAASTFEFIHTIIALLIIFALIALLLIFYLVLHKIRITRQLFNLEMQDVKYKCYNRHGFEVTAQEMLNRNPHSNFSVISLQLRHYQFLIDTYGADMLSGLVWHIRCIIGKTVGLEETYGHVGEGMFLLLLHTKDRIELQERLKILAFLCMQYEKKHKFDVLTSLGIYEVDHEDRILVTQMIDYANEAKGSTTGGFPLTAGMQVNYYSDEMRKARLFNEDMELRMASALENGEFKVFFQPKYNLQNGKQDGCEALVRWYDAPKDQYNRPALFMELFESNGFITKLDEFVYTKVCEYISYSIAHGRAVYPVSVNVSRVTAMQPGFVDFYAKTKRKYGIRDGLITIEFTETFAYENYESLLKIVNGLHENGFACSIDDFGCGYSSYRILKSLPMDEIKLDKFFLEPGISEERDRHIFESIIGVAKKMGMKVTQEGVEKYEEVIRLKELNCDVIQGYYYSYPLSLSDYISFTTYSHSHDILLTPSTAKT